MCGSFAFPAGEFRYVIHAATEASAKQAAEEPLEMLIDGPGGDRTNAAVCGPVRRAEIPADQLGRGVWTAAARRLTHLPESV